MKLISLNTLGGYFFPALMEFIGREAASTDVFLFQEVCDAAADVPNVQGFRSNFFTELQLALPDFDGSFRAIQEHAHPNDMNCPFDVAFGKATFVRKGFSITHIEDVVLTSAPELWLSGTAFITRIRLGDTQLTLCNVHACPEPVNKRDCPERIAASHEIIEKMAHESGEKIIAGDFNLFPDTESIGLFAKNGYRNLIVDHKIKTTRGTLMKKMHPEYGLSADGWHEFADYTFVSNGVRIISFEVPDLPLSDHLPMILEFDIA